MFCFFFWLVFSSFLSFFLFLFSPPPDITWDTNRYGNAKTDPSFGGKHVYQSSLLSCTLWEQTAKYRLFFSRLSRLSRLSRPPRSIVFCRLSFVLRWHSVQSPWPWYCIEYSPGYLSAAAASLTQRLWSYCLIAPWLSLFCISCHLWYWVSYWVPCFCDLLSVNAAVMVKPDKDGYLTKLRFTESTAA